MVVSLFAPHVTYVETCVGSGAVLFYKAPSICEIINDANLQLMNFYQVVKFDFEALQLQVVKTLHHRRYHEQAVVIYHYPELFTPVQRAWAVWVLCKQSFASRLDGHWGYSKLDNSSSDKTGYSKLTFTRQYADRLEAVQLETRDALYLIKTRDTADTLFYCDPPYFNSSSGSSQFYTQKHFASMLQALANIQGKFLLSSYPSPLLNEYVQTYQWHQVQLEMNVSLNKNHPDTKTKTEVFTANYPLQQMSSRQGNLFDTGLPV